MATNIDLRGQGAREHHTAQTSWISVNLNFASFNVGSADIPFPDPLPAGARILRAYTVVSQAYNAGTNNQIGIGNVSGGQQIVANVTNLTGLGTNAQTLVASAATFVTSQTQLWVHNNVTGTAATTGNVDVIVEYATVHGPQDAF